MFRRKSSEFNVVVASRPAPARLLRPLPGRWWRRCCLPGCSSTPSPGASEGARRLTSRISSFFGSSRKSLRRRRRRASRSPPTYDCPSVDIRRGAGTLNVAAKSGDATAGDLRYQLSLRQTARECLVQGGTMIIRVGVQGRIILGPYGGPGQVDIPLRYAVVREGSQPTTIMTKFKRFAATVPPGETNVEFTDIEDGLTFPMPSAARTLRLSWSMSASTRSATATKEKPPPKTAKKKAANKRHGRRLVGRAWTDRAFAPGQYPRSATTVPFRCRMSATMVRAPAAVSSSPRLAVGVAAADEADRGHAGGGGGGDAGRRVLDHDAVGRGDFHAVRDMQEQVGRGLAVGERRLRKTDTGRRTATGRWFRGSPRCGRAATTRRRISVRAARSAHTRRAARRAVRRAGASASPCRPRSRSSAAACGGSRPRRAATMSAGRRPKK